MTSVLHVALNPVTGPWSVMRELAKAQSFSGLYGGVGIGLILTNDWPKEYQAELGALDLPTFQTRTPRLFGTASFLWQRLQRPPVADWVRQLARTSGAESVIVHFHNAWLSGVFVPLAAPPGVRVTSIATFHGVNADFIGQPIRHRLHRWMAQRLLRNNTRLTSVDSKNPEVAEKIFGIPRQCFSVIPNGVPAVAQAEGNARKHATAALFVGHVGTLNQVKGWRVAAAAVRGARATGRDVRFLVAGTGAEESEVRHWARENPEWFEYAGFVHDPQKNILPRLDAFVLMAEREGLPMAIIEAMSLGIPVIATPVGGIPDAVIHEQTGLLISRDVLSLSTAICGLYDDREKLQGLGTKARARFQAEFEIGRIVESYQRLYHSTAE